MRPVFFGAFLTFATQAMADPPKVAADILPVHSLVARVMQGVGAPELVLPPGASPHSYSMRPSEASTLEQSDLVFWVGEGLTPWLAGPLDVLAADATKIALLDHPATRRIELSESDDHDHDDHDHGPVDPHAWLDPNNAKIWLAEIAERLSAADPENAEVYQTNASEARTEVDRLLVDMAKKFEFLHSASFAVYHDAYGYLERPFHVHPAVKLLDSEAAKPTPRRIAETRKKVVSQGVQRIFIEPGTNVSIIETIFEGVPVTVCEVDPMGGHIASGPKHYWHSMLDLANAMGRCGAS